MTDWFARPVLHVKDVESSLRFYVDRLGFTSPWRYQEAGRTHVAQAERQGCALIMADQWPEKVGKGLIFSRNRTLGISEELDPLLRSAESQVFKCSGGIVSRSGQYRVPKPGPRAACACNGQEASGFGPGAGPTEAGLR
jgi:hypothetical protein